MRITVFLFLIYFSTFVQADAQRLVFRPFPKSTSNMITVDSGNIRVWYALNAVDINKLETYDDWQRLEIGAHLSKYFSHFVHNSDSLCTDGGKKIKEQDQLLAGWDHPVKKIVGRNIIIRSISRIFP
jgi:hypothetical protein